MDKQKEETIDIDSINRGVKASIAVINKSLVGLYGDYLIRYRRTMETFWETSAFYFNHQYWWRPSEANKIPWLFSSWPICPYKVLVIYQILGKIWLGWEGNWVILHQDRRFKMEKFGLGESAASVRKRICAGYHVRRCISG